eukprot:1094889-Pelagomonas_calceolata.AAC.7
MRTAILAHRLVTLAADAAAGKLVTLAAGAAAGKFLRYEEDAPGVAAQTAYGIEAEVENYDQGAAIPARNDLRTLLTSPEVQGSIPTLPGLPANKALEEPGLREEAL